MLRSRGFPGREARGTYLESPPDRSWSVASRGAGRRSRTIEVEEERGMGNHKALRLWASFAVVAAAIVAASPARADDAFTLSGATIPADSSWRNMVIANDATTLKPVKVTAARNVANAGALLEGSGTATPTNVAGQAPRVLMLDYGKEVGGLPFFGVSSVSPV